MAATNLLLLPGLLCDANYWQPQIKGLGTRAQCLVADYGMADSLEAMARMALAQADAAGMHGPLAVAAHSMGGRVAFELLRIAPQRVERLALLDTGFHPFAGGEAGDKERAGRMALKFLDPSAPRSEKTQSARCRYCGQRRRRLPESRQYCQEIPLY